MFLLSNFCKISLFFFLSIKLFGNWDLETTFDVKNVTEVLPSPQGDKVLYVVKSAKDDSWFTSAFIDNVRLTERSAQECVWSTDGKKIFFLSNDQIWKINLDGSEEIQLTNVEGSIVTFQLSPDENSIAFVMKPCRGSEELPIVVNRLNNNASLFLLSLQNKAVTRLTSDDFHVGTGFSGSHFDWSPDGKMIAFPKMPSSSPDDWTKSEIYQIDVKTLKLFPLVQNAYGATPYYSPDGKTIAYVSSPYPVRWEMVFDIALVPSVGGQSKKLHATFNQSPGWNLGNFLGWSKDGKNLYVSEIYKTKTAIYSLPANGDAPQKLGVSEKRLYSISINASKEVFGFTSSSSNTPPEGSTWDLSTGCEKQITHVNEKLPLDKIAKTEIIQWKSKDGLEIEGLLTYPLNYEKGKKYPLLLIIHGGPAHLFQENFIGEPLTYPIATFAANGFAILRCNIRGSNGYGKEFRFANFRDWGGMDYWDLMTGVDHVIEMGLADRDKLGVMGWSYGGFMTAWITTKTDRFKAASVGAGPVNLISMAGTTDITSFIPGAFGKALCDDFQFCLAHSPLYSLCKVKTPTLMQYGQIDERVPLSQGYEWYNALRRRHVPVEFIIYPKTKHQFDNPALQLDAARRNFNFFKENLSFSSE